ncbi:glycyl-radical enzyme activating protein [Chloroflexota bacterium]
MQQGGRSGTIFNIQKFSVHDGPGIRTTVFMKGCPLQCRWCSNAESMNPEPELGIIYSSCNNCGKCIDVCPENAIIIKNESIRFDRKKCTACGECIGVCAPGALTVYGKQVSVEDVFKEVNKDKSFYEGSSGGVTASGGEPLRQADFVAALFQMCREAGIGTCLDTCGYAPTDRLEKVLAFTDYVLYDIKHMNAEAHKQFTGMPNDLILHNAKVVAESKAEMLCRIPLIKDVNDTEENISETAKFLKTLGKDISIELLPYHRLGIGKYKTLDRAYPGETFIKPSDEETEATRKIFENYSVPCTIGE